MADNGASEQGAPFVVMDADLALLVGNVAGALARMAHDLRHIAPTKVEVEVRDGNYTNRILVSRPSGRYTVTIEGPDA